MSYSSLLPRSFRGQLAWFVALLVGALAVSLSAALGTLMARQSERDEGDAVHSIARGAARTLADGLVQREHEVRILAESPTIWVDGLGAERVRQVLLRSQALNPFNTWVGVTDAAGVVRNATADLLLGADVHDRPWFEGGLQGTFVGDVHAAKLLAAHFPAGSDGGPQRFVDFAAPIRQGGRTVGVIAIRSTWAWARATIDSLLPGDAAARELQVYILDRQGRPISSPDRGVPAPGDTGQHLRLPLAGPAGAARVVTWADGNDYLTAAVALPLPPGPSQLGWTVVAREPVAVAYAGARHAAAMALALGLLAAAVASVLGGWVASRLTLPLRRIAESAQAVQAGATDLPPQHGSVEIEHLSGALGAMTRRLVLANAQLEQRVAERTADLERANAVLAQLARHDPLTGLLNRRGLDERVLEVLAGARRRGTAVAVMLIDVDHFKRVNDRHGHDAGDQVLQALAATLRQRLRAGDLLARVGGEEFVALLPDTDAASARLLAEKLVARIAGLALPVVGSATISIGVAALAVGQETPQAALRRADAALYRAKQGGRNRMEFAAADADTTAAA